MKTLIDISPERTGNIFRMMEIFPKIKDAEVIKSMHLLQYKYHINEYATPYKKIDLLKNKYPDAYVFYVDRNKDKWIVSLYNHWVKYGGSLSFDDWYNKIMDKCIFETDEVIEYAKKVFGNNFYLLNFERFMEEPEAEFNRLLSHFGLNTIPIDNIRYNVSFNGKQVNLCRILNKIFNKHCIGRNWIKLISKQ